MSATPLDIVIVSYNASAALAACLASLTEHAPARPHRVVVVDNASTDDSCGVAARVAPAALVLPQTRNLGFARANNIGIRATGSPLVLLLNSDTVVGSGAIDALVAGLESKERAVAAGPRLVDAEARVEVSWGPMMGPFNELRQKLLGTLYARGVGPVVRHIERLARTPREVAWVSGACLLVRRPAGEDAGWLDERFFMYAEDVDFCASLRSRGGRVLYVPDAEVRHLRGRSRATAADATYAHYRRSQLAFYEKHHPAWVPWLRLYVRLTTRSR
jgi:hypothetical protein